MKRQRAVFGWTGCLAVSLVSCLFFVSVTCGAQARSAVVQHARSDSRTETASVTALFVSDIHFEPFWDPSKASQLATVPATEWKPILASPASADRALRFTELQVACHARGTDTPDSLFQSSLQAMRANASDARFMTISGDLIAHEFSCKYARVFPHSRPEDYRAFVRKTLEYVLMEVHSAFPGMPVFAALGNNDSDCGDYQLDPNSGFLRAVGQLFSASFPPAERESAERSMATGGFYSISLPPPLQHAKLLVINDLFFSAKYQTCRGKSDPAPANAQLEWLRAELTKSRVNHEHVWIVGHIPPGIDPYSTAIKMRNVCAGQAPEMFLSSDQLPDLLKNFGDVVQLAVFAHTHLDELRILKTPQAGPGVAIKMVPSISPINGNSPSFTVATVDATTATLKDYRVFTASNQTGINAEWRQEYEFAKDYQQPAFTAETVEKLVDSFKADQLAQAAGSRNYLHDLGLHERAFLIAPFWPQFVCGLSNYTAASYKACVCSNAQAVSGGK